MTDFGVPHLAARQSDGFTGCRELRHGMGGRDRSPGGCCSLADGIARPGFGKTPAVKDAKDQRPGDECGHGSTLVRADQRLQAVASTGSDAGIAHIRSRL